MTGNGPIYVYGVVSTDPSISLPGDGVANASTRLVESNGLAAVVSSVPDERLRVRRRDLDAHLRALEELFGQTTVLPCRFGTVMPSEEDVRQHLLDARRDDLHALLEGLAGRAQMNVKAEYDEPEVLREVVESDAQIARLRERAKALGDAAYYENIRLGELITAHLAARRMNDAQRIYTRLAPLVTDVAGDDEDASATLVLKASFLVERKRLDRFDEELESLAKEESPTMRFEALGPLPPTAFVSLGQEGWTIGLLTGLLTLPLAPVRGTMWIAERLLEEAERELNDPAAIEQQLVAAERAHERGELTDDELADIEDALLRRLTGQEAEWYGGTHE